jgi:hypothetical protein
MENASGREFDDDDKEEEVTPCDRKPSWLLR